MKRSRWILSKYSLITGLVLSLYFVIMDLLGYSHITELRLVNGVILGFGIWQAIKAKSQENDWNYLSGLRSGFKTGLGAVALFCIVFLLYTGFINPEIVSSISMTTISPLEIDVFLLLAIVILEGLASAAIMSFMVMQYYKSKSVQSESNVSQPIES